MSSILEKIRDQIKIRAQVLHGENPLDWSERLATSFSRYPGRSAQEFMLLRHVDSSNPHFSVQGRRVHYEPPYPVKDPQYLKKGICQVITESFVFPNFFNGEVQINPGDTVFDLGANIGTTAMLFSNLVGETGKVYAFEPVTHETIRLNLKENGIRNVEVVAAAVGDTDSEIEIEVSDFCLDSSITKREYTKGYYSKTIKVPLIKLDTFIAQAGIKKVHFVKMDIEGAEELALNGFTSGLKNMKPKWSISSYHIDFQNEPQHPKLVKILDQYGYAIKEKRKSHIYAW